MKDKVKKIIATKRGKKWILIVFEGGEKLLPSTMFIVNYFNELFPKGNKGYLDSLIKEVFREGLSKEEYKNFESYEIKDELKKKIKKLEEKYEKLFYTGEAGKIKVTLKEMIKVIVGIGYCEDYKYRNYFKAERRFRIERLVLEALEKCRTYEEKIELDSKYDEYNKIDRHK